MSRGVSLLTSLLCSLCLLAMTQWRSTAGYSRNLKYIPNVGEHKGDHSYVPAPFGVANRTCQSIGHIDSCDGNPDHGGNHFGHEFNSAFKRHPDTWQREFCLKDSDGDGFSNGYELGDPECVWKPGAHPMRVSGLSHPGYSCSTPSDPFCMKHTGNTVAAGPNKAK
ncbi:temptin-like [Sycon ciliatum]|uniref:temptin-like n=1 Tax=Sycon ciliatum TaxID=27933 RepID=UPI0031F689FA